MRNRRINRWVLGISLLMLLPVAVMTLMLSLGAIDSLVRMLRTGAKAEDYAGIAVLALPVLMMVWGVGLFVRLGSGYQAGVRWSLLAFYLVKLACWVGLLVNSTLSRDGGEARSAFSPQTQAWGICLALIPPLVVLMTKAETRDESVTWRL